MKKIIYIIAGILVAASIAMIVIYNNKKVSPEIPQTASPEIPSLPPSTELAEKGQAAIPTDQGSVIINDPYKKALTVVSGNAELLNTDSYVIVYLGELKSFVITLYGADLNDSRNIAEQAFLESLNIDKDAACKLKITLAVAPEASKSAAGKNYGLSFCPNGKPLPAN
ncbi:MAG: hypothetical protein WC643_00405 [Parcubacteria group bacterium]|jgi:hypothetical protein